MPNKNYLKGRRKEYKICEELKKQGYEIVQRSAGSHSPIDIWAVNKELQKITLIQCKPDNMPESEKKKILEDLNWLNEAFLVEVEVI